MTIINFIIIIVVNIRIFMVIIKKITISSIVIGLRKLLFSTNSLAKLLSNILLSAFQ